MLVTDTDGRTELDYVEIAINMTSGDIVLRWDEQSKVFSEILDTGGLCTINTVNSTWEVVDANSYRLAWRFEINGGVHDTFQEYRYRAIDEASNKNPTFTALRGLFEYTDSFIIEIDDFNLISSSPIVQSYYDTHDLNEPENNIVPNVTINHGVGVEWIYMYDITISENVTENVLTVVAGRLYGFWSWMPTQSTGWGSNDIDLGNNSTLKHGHIDDNTIWFTPELKVKQIPAGRYNMSIMVTDFNYLESKFFLGWVDIGDSFNQTETAQVNVSLYNQTGVEVEEVAQVDSDFFMQTDVEDEEADSITQGLHIWLNGVLVHNSYQYVLAPAELGAINLFDSEDFAMGDNSWLYEGELYRLRAVTYNPTYVNINVSDTRRTIVFDYYNSTDTLSLYSSDNVDVFGLIRSANTFNASTGRRVLEWWFVVNEDVIDCADRYWDAYMNSTINIPVQPLQIDIKNDWLKTNIYNLGGIVSYSFVGDGRRVADGDVYDIMATSAGSIARTEVVYDKLQHVHILPELNVNGTWNPTTGRFEDFDGGFFEYGLKYEVDGLWVQGYKVRLYPTNYRVGHQNLGADHNWVGWAVEWYQFTQNNASWTLQKEDIIYTNNWGYDNDDATPDYHNRTSSQLWIDLWFSNHEGGTIMAGRVSALYYGLYEQATPFWFGYGEFRPMFGDVTSSQFFGDITDFNGGTTDSYGIEKVNFWTRVEKISGNTRPWKVSNYEVRNYQLAEGRMQGIDNPPFIETRVLDSPTSGFLTPLIKVISGIGNAIGNALRGMATYTMSLVDTMLTNIGLPPMLSIFFDFLMGIYEIFALIYSSFVDIVSWITSSIENMIGSLFLVIPRYLLLVTDVLNVFVSYYTNFVLLFTGGIGNMNNFWADYSMGEIIQVYLVAVVPFTFLAKWESSKDPINAIAEDVGMFVQFVTAIYDIASEFMGLAFDIIKSILGLI